MTTKEFIEYLKQAEVKFKETEDTIVIEQYQFHAKVLKNKNIHKATYDFLDAYSQNHELLQVIDEYVKTPIRERVKNNSKYILRLSSLFSERLLVKHNLTNNYMFLPVNESETKQFMDKYPNFIYLFDKKEADSIIESFDITMEEVKMPKQRYTHAYDGDIGIVLCCRCEKVLDVDNEAVEYKREFYCDDCYQEEIQEEEDDEVE